jgi:hypothetical protein
MGAKPSRTRGGFALRAADVNRPGSAGLPASRNCHDSGRAEFRARTRPGSGRQQNERLHRGRTGPGTMVRPADGGRQHLESA